MYLNFNNSKKEKIKQQKKKRKLFKYEENIMFKYNI